MGVSIRSNLPSAKLRLDPWEPPPQPSLFFRGGMYLKSLKGCVFARPSCLPDNHPLARRQIHLVALLDAVCRVEPRLVRQGAEHAEFGHRMRIGLDELDHAVVAHFVAPGLGEALIK